MTPDETSAEQRLYDAAALWTEAPGRDVKDLIDAAVLNRPGSDGGSQSMEDESYGSTEEVPRRVV